MTITEQIKSKADIVDIVSEFVTLAKKGKNYWGLCPFHNDSNPSMSVSPEKQIYSCFTCHASGNVISFYADFNKVSYKTATEALCKKLGIPFIESSIQAKYSESQQKIIDLMNHASNFYENELNSECGREALKYLVARKVTQEEINKFKIGFAKGEKLIKFLQRNYSSSDIITSGLANDQLNEFFRNRLIFAITNQYGDVVGFSARTLSADSNENKYINSPATILFDKSKILYNYVNAIDYARRDNEIIICEGFFDVIALSKSGFPNAVAIMGTALTPNHLNLIKNLKIRLMLDADSAGQVATYKSLETLLRNKFEVSVIDNKNNQEKLDPDELVSKYGNEKLKEVISQTTDGFVFLFKKLQNECDINNPNSINNLLKKLIPLIPTHDQTTFKIYKNKIANELKISPEIIDELFNIETPVFDNEKNVKDHKKQFNKYELFIFQLVKTLLDNPDFAQLYLDTPPPISDPNTIALKEIALKSTNKINQYENPLAKTLVDSIENKEIINIIKSKNIFFDIINQLSLESLKITRNNWKEQLKNNKYSLIENQKEAKEIQERIKLINIKIEELRKG